MLKNPHTSREDYRAQSSRYCGLMAVALFHGISLTGLNPGSCSLFSKLEIINLYPTCLCIELDAMHRFLQALLFTRFSNTFGYSVLSIQHRSNPTIMNYKHVTIASSKIAIACKSSRRIIDSQTFRRRR